MALDDLPKPWDLPPLNPFWLPGRALDRVKDETPMGAPLRAVEQVDGAVSHVPGGWSTVALLVAVLLAFLVVRALVPATWRAAKTVAPVAASVAAPYAGAAASVAATRRSQAKADARERAGRAAAPRPTTVSGFAPVSLSPRSVIGTRLRAPDWMRKHRAVPGRGEFVDESLSGCVVCHDGAVQARVYAERRRMGWEARQVTDEPCDLSPAKRHVGFVFVRKARPAARKARAKPAPRKSTAKPVARKPTARRRS